MRLAIDASNIREGGGVTHLVEILRVFDPQRHGFDEIDIWACRNTLTQIEDRPWIKKHSAPALEGSLIKRLLWQRFELGRRMRARNADLVFSPGGSIVADFRPVVTMSRNMLPFEWTELKRFGPSLIFAKLLLLRRNQSKSFRNADGVIFLTKYARTAVMKITGALQGKVTVIPHGTDNRFVMVPRPQRSLLQISEEKPLRVVYVSTVDAFKHQCTVARAVARLRSEGLPIRIDFYGSARARWLRKLEETLRSLDGAGHFTAYHGPVPYQKVHACYADADISVFASSCENMPNILIESMAAALPIACSNSGPMPEVLQEAGVYFDPENERSIAEAIRQLANSESLRATKARDASQLAAVFSWKRCADETFAFLASVANSRRPMPE